MGLELEKIFNSGILRDFEVDILKLRFGFYGRIMTLREVGEIYNVKGERIRQIEQKALGKLIHYSKIDSLVAFCDDPDILRKQK